MESDGYGYRRRIRFSLDEHTVDGLELTLEHLRRAFKADLLEVGSNRMHTVLYGSFCLVRRRSDGGKLLTLRS